MEKIIFINSHPVQYFAPLYKYLKERNLPIEVWYCSDLSLVGGYDKEFGLNVKWNLPLLEGYPSKFLKNNSRYPSVSDSFFGVINWEIINTLRKEQKAYIIVNGWQFFTYLLAILFAIIYKHKLCMRFETPWIHEVKKITFVSKLKRILLRILVFPHVSYFFYIGNQNYNFYQHFKIPKSKLLYTPYAVDNKRFFSESERLKLFRPSLRKKFEIPDDDVVILFSGKYIYKKRPMDLLRAFNLLYRSNVWLIMMGEGELRPEMENYIIENELKRVILTGFVNQNAVSEYYSISDLFVMCSGIGETWGLSVNEAMNFSLPIIVSDMTGCASDLVVEGKNGSIFSTGNVEMLKDKILFWISNKAVLANAGEISKNIIEKYSFKVIADTFEKHLS